MTMTDKTPFLIRLENCSARLGRATILHGLDWTLRQGCHWLLLGANGAGKSTFLALVRGDIPPAPARPGEPAGRRIYGPGLSHDGEPTQSPIGLRQRLALVSAELQDRYVRRALGEEDRRAWNLTALDLAVAGLRDTPLVYSPPEPSEKMAALTALEALGATHLAGTGVQDMSRGQARLAFIARALAGRPDVLLCDEVLDGLDPTARDMISGALERLAASGSTTIVLSTHRTDEAPVWAERALLLAGGRITAHGPAAKVLKRSPAARGLDRPGENRTDALHEANGTDRAMPWLVRVDKATLLRGGRPALSDVDWTVLPGQRWGVFGHNGAGRQVADARVRRRPGTTVILTAVDAMLVRGGIHQVGRLRMDFDRIGPVLVVRTADILQYGAPTLPIVRAAVQDALPGRVAIVGNSPRTDVNPVRAIRIDGNAVDDCIRLNAIRSVSPRLPAVDALVELTKMRAGVDFVRVLRIDRQDLDIQVAQPVDGGLPGLAGIVALEDPTAPGTRIDDIRVVRVKLDVHDNPAIRTQPLCAFENLHPREIQFVLNGLLLFRTQGAPPDHHCAGKYNHDHKRDCVVFKPFVHRLNYISFL